MQKAHWQDWHVGFISAKMGVDILATQFPLSYLWKCTLYTTWEPCAMCAATIYWANIGRVVFGASNEMLDMLVGEHPENLTMTWDCRTIFQGGKKDIQVIGPVESVAPQIIALSREYWHPNNCLSI